MDDFDKFYGFMREKFLGLNIGLSRDRLSLVIQPDDFIEFTRNVFDYFILNYGIYDNYNRIAIKKIEEKYGTKETER